jgi:leucyl aminopeptidase
MTHTPTFHAVDAHTVTQQHFAQGQYDGLVVVFTAVTSLTKDNGLHAGSLAAVCGGMEAGHALISTLVAGNRAFVSGTSPILHLLQPKMRLLFVPTGPVAGDVDDVRRYGEAGRRVFAACARTGITSPLVVFADPPSEHAVTWVRQDFQHYLTVCMLGMLQEAYVPLQAREHVAARSLPALPGQDVLDIGLVVSGSAEMQAFAGLLHHVQAVNAGLHVAKGVCLGVWMVSWLHSLIHYSCFINRHCWS